jgi:uncharacterized protein involved in exopolysaccharide biosynthesis
MTEKTQYNHSQDALSGQIKFAQQENEMSLLDYLRVLIVYKWMFGFVVLLVTAISIVLAFYMTPVYQAKVLLAPVDQDYQKKGLSGLVGQLGGLAPLAGVSLGGSSGDTQTAIATLTSRAFTDKVVKELGLLPVLFEEKWDKENQRWLVNKASEVPSMWDAYKRFNEIRQITEDKKTGLYTLTIEWTDPVLAAEWANKLVERINANLREEAMVETEKNLKYLHEQINKTDVIEIQKSLYSLLESEIKKAMLANGSVEYAFRVLDPAVVPEERIRPKRRLIILLGIIFGCFLGIVAVLFRNLLVIDKNRRQHADAAK